MKNKFFAFLLFLSVLCGSAWGDVAINEANFPDETFRRYVSLIAGNNEILTDNTIELTTQIDVSEGNIHSLKGIEYFTALEYLKCSSNDISELDLSMNKNLKNLFCDNNQIKALNLNGLNALKFLTCSNNQLETLNLTGTSLLSTIDCSMNQIEELDLGGRERLLDVICHTNNIKSLNVRNCSSLFELDCNGNQFTEIDLTGCSSLQYLICSMNYLSHLDVTALSDLRELYCSDTILRNLDVSKNINLEVLDCQSSHLTFLDLSNNSELKTLLSDGNEFMNLRITSSDNESYPFMTDLKEYASDYFTRIKSVMAYDGDGTEIGTLFTPSERYAYFSSSPIYIAYELGNGYTGSAPESDVPREMIIVVSLPRNALYVPELTLHHKTLNWDSNLGFTQGLLDTLCDSFSGIQISDIHLFDDIISSDTWTPTSEDSEFLAASSQQYLFSLPLTQAKTEGVYVLKCTFNESVRSGDKISVYDMNGRDSEIADYVFIDESYSVIDYVPENRNLYLAVRLHSGITNRQAVTASSSNRVSGLKGSGGGCNSFFGIMMMLPVIIFMRRRKIFVSLMLILILQASYAYGDIRPSDYNLPIEYETYNISGTWTMDFNLSRELIDAVIRAVEDGLKPENVHLYSEIASGTWEAGPSALYNLAMSGLYGAVVLPLTESGTSDVYVLMCTLSNDVQPGEQLVFSGCTVDTSTHEFVDDERNMSLCIFLDDNLNQVTSVPQNRRVYVAVSLRPEGVTNTGILSVMRGEYVKETDPLSRLDPELAKIIADQLGIPVEELNFISQNELAEPEEATPSIRQYVRNDNHEIISGINMLSVNKDGWYVFQVTLSDDVWEEVKGKAISSFKFYGLSDSEFNSGEVNSSIISEYVIGFINAQELFGITGQKLEIFSVQTFLLAAFLKSGTPFTVYLARLLLMLLSGCDSGLTPSLISVLILGMIILKARRR